MSSDIFYSTLQPAFSEKALKKHPYADQHKDACKNPDHSGKRFLPVRQQVLQPIWIIPNLTAVHFVYSNAQFVHDNLLRKAQTAT